ncbi:MAG: cysteine--tRNA ligase [Bacteroidetes bacterium]|nr:cysteine--tRNA ligase [Bacteroidota bacterium]
MTREFRIYNTLTNRIEELEPRKPGHLTFYSCGPTVYSYAHIGNFRSFLTADLILRTAQAIGWEVTYATNVTDVGHLTEDDLTDPSGEDRMVKALQSKEGEAFVNVWDLARYYTQTLIQDWHRLNLREPSVRPRATEHMREQIAAVQKLVENGHAYETEKGVYFSVTSFPDYGKLSGNTLDNELEQTVRDVVVDTDKKDPRDFALWKKDDKHLMQWFSPWGWGFPGWHIECSVMAMSYLGEEIDLHAGGEDLIFPHHECEIAQSESLTGKPFSRIWAHTRFLQVEGEKMSKSTGNFFTVRDLSASEAEGGKGIDPLAVRMTLLSGHYRKPFNFTMKTLRGNVKHCDRLQEVIKLVGDPSENHGSYETEAGVILGGMYQRALEAMLDDLNTPTALASLFGGTKLILGKGDALDEPQKADVRRWLADMNALLGVVYHDEQTPAEANEEDPLAAKVDPLIEERRAARADGNWARADEIRDELAALGVDIMDSAEGTTWKRKSSV